MATQLVSETPRFGLLHFCPDPERGERVCVGMWLDDGKRISVEYDERFHHLHCIAPDFDPRLVRLLLDDLDQSLSDARWPEAETIMKQYGPQLISTEPRRVLAPITRELRERLRNKFLVSERELAIIDQVEARGERSSENQTTQRIHSYVRSLIRATDVTILERPTLQSLFGSTPRIRTPRVALAVERPNKLVLVDGVDLNVMKARRAVNRVNEIVYAFWQSARLKDTTLIWRDRALQRAGVVLNGISQRQRALVEAHDYAIDRFKTEAELAVDASTDQGREQLIAALND